MEGVYQKAKNGFAAVYECKGLPKAAPENRISTRSCAKTKPADVDPVITVEPATISAPEATRAVVDPRTATNTTVKPPEPIFIFSCVGYISHIRLEGSPIWAAKGGITIAQY